MVPNLKGSSFQSYPVIGATVRYLLGVLVMQRRELLTLDRGDQMFALKLKNEQEFTRERHRYWRSMLCSENYKYFIFI